MKTLAKKNTKLSGEQIIQKKIEETSKLLKGVDLSVLFKETSTNTTKN
ncbi:MAG: hypothetical protein MUF45_19210 [Spirosomaceae bacterium]|jgi:hypothetical protein|nr:hypothetical protein [Spirosomataceae bacterium]